MSEIIARIEEQNAIEKQEVRHECIASIALVQFTKQYHVEFKRFCQKVWDNRLHFFSFLMWYYSLLQTLVQSMIGSHNNLRVTTCDSQGTKCII